MGRTWPDKEKKHETPFFSFSPLFSFYPLCENMWIWIADWINQSPLSVKTAKSDLPTLRISEFWKIFGKSAKINTYGGFTWSVYWNACKTLFLKPWILKIFLEVQIIWMNRSHRFRAKKCYFRIAKSRIFGYLVHLKHFIWREK